MAPTATSADGRAARLRAAIPHAVPGRLRLKLQGRQAEVREVLRAVRDTLSGQNGIVQVTAEPRTGSALILFNPEELDLQTTVALLQKAHAALAEVMPPALHERARRPMSAVAAAVAGKLARADHDVLQATQGVVDLRMLVPIGLAGLSVRQVLRYGVRFRQVPWYVLAYYAFDTFVKLHQTPVRVEPIEPATTGAPS